MGLVFKDVDAVVVHDCPFVVGRFIGLVLLLDGVKGSLVMSGKEVSSPALSRTRNSIDLTKTT